MKIYGALRIVRPFTSRHFNFFNFSFWQTDIFEPAVHVLVPFLEVFFPFSWFYKEFKFHDFQFSDTEDKIARADFVTESLTYLSNAKRQIWLEAIDNVLKIGEHALGCFGSQISCAGLIINRSDISLKHHVKFTRFAKSAFLAAIWTLINPSGTGFAVRLWRSSTGLTPWNSAMSDNSTGVNLICPESCMAVTAFHQRIMKSINMTTSLPNFLIHQNGRIN